ncbi:MAG: chorismate synthase [Bdellovibrio sp. CG12_big_fil_rev_8_21_14_0_65_39_13]|nr:MAG: chorismate synthase [Bdellovibrio sp. CG22_combo_CG10-13_8_21_14_all_39_27]PIQ58051.1 MAG: chorismate synthase [Bdellovibrio sp. CG12_big_fil_rev_8_21_14_0_65_39_13]PIR32927.1 MAG: chorismate synthase [Bdellovibrio sp. CG11_big_fil_rev_8_21_14_0_20_39_38]
MRGNTFGKMLSITSFGESHGTALGVVVDGVPPGLKFNLKDLQSELDRRAPGNIEGTTARKEPDTAEVLSGVFEDQTLGTPICVIVKNTNQRSSDYEKIKEDHRPGHADKTTMLKYGIRDHRGGGRSSGRETLARVIGGYFAQLMMPQMKVRGWMTKLGPFESRDISKLDINGDYGPYSYPDKSKSDEIKNYLLDLKKNGESRGGQVRVMVQNCPMGLGEPSFDKLKADLAKAILSIGAVVAFSYGSGEEMAELDGSVVSKDSSHFGGMEGGITNGDPIVLNITFKPTSTVGDKAKEGRHDPCIIPRAIPVVESMIKLTIADHYLRQQAYAGFSK